MTNDEQWARQVIAHAPSDPPAKARMADWSPEMERLTDLCDLLSEAIRAMAQLKGVRPGPRKHMPRPRTALDRERNRQRWRQHNSLAARLLPHKAAEPADSDS